MNFPSLVRWFGSLRRGGFAVGSESLQMGYSLFRVRRVVWVRWLCGILLMWLVVAYGVLPLWWERYERKHPAAAMEMRRALTAEGIPGDPLNLWVEAGEDELVSGLLKAGWYPADPVSLETSLRIAADATFHRSYDDAPVSSLYLFGRKQDHAFEKPVGNDPRQRHHVRFWLAPEDGSTGRRCWWGAATFDRSVGLSRDTGEVTHHIAAEVDPERDRVLADLARSGVGKVSYVERFQELSGKNGGGDPWRSDGRLGVVSGSGAAGE